MGYAWSFTWVYSGSPEIDTLVLLQRLRLTGWIYSVESPGSFLGILSACSGFLAAVSAWVDKVLQWLWVVQPLNR